MRRYAPPQWGYDTYRRILWYWPGGRLDFDSDISKRSWRFSDEFLDDLKRDSPALRDAIQAIFNDHGSPIELWRDFVKAVNYAAEAQGIDIIFDDRAKVITARSTL